MRTILCVKLLQRFDNLSIDNRSTIKNNLDFQIKSTDCDSTQIKRCDLKIKVKLKLLPILKLTSLSSRAHMNSRMSKKQI